MLFYHCEETSQKNAFNLYCHTKALHCHIESSPCHTERSEVSKRRQRVDSSASHQNDNKDLK